MSAFVGEGVIRPVDVNDEYLSAERLNNLARSRGDFRGLGRLLEPIHTQFVCPPSMRPNRDGDAITVNQSEPPLIIIGIFEPLSQLIIIPWSPIPTADVTCSETFPTIGIQSAGFDQASPHCCSVLNSTPGK